MIIYISARPENFGSDATQADADRGARIIRDRLSEIYTDVEFRIGEGRNEYTEEDAGTVDEIDIAIDANWTDWISDATPETETWLA